MTWSYSGNPADSGKDAVRFLVGDTDTTSQIVSDEEIAWAILQESNVHFAASKIAKAIAGKYARKVDKAVGDLKITWSQLTQQFMTLADDLEKRGGVSSGIPYVGGISIDDKESVQDDSDRVKPSFSRGMNSVLNEQDPENNLLSS